MVMRLMSHLYSCYVYITQNRAICTLCLIGTARFCAVFATVFVASHQALPRQIPRYKNYICYICMQHICNKEIHICVFWTFGTPCKSRNTKRNLCKNYVHRIN